MDIDTGERTQGESRSRWKVHFTSSLVIPKCQLHKMNGPWPLRVPRPSFGYGMGTLTHSLTTLQLQNPRGSQEKFMRFLPQVAFLKDKERCSPGEAVTQPPLIPGSDHSMSPKA